MIKGTLASNVTKKQKTWTIMNSRQQAGAGERLMGSLSAARALAAGEGALGLWRGYGPNIAYAFPADAIKFLVYERLKAAARGYRGGAKLGPLEAAVLGSGASMTAQALTTPLDVVRTRAMMRSREDDSDELYKAGVPDALAKIAEEEGLGALWAGTSPRVARSVLSGAIQFSSYEFVKGLFGVEPRKL
ncbi:unnamed protein product [Discosporangium mesarthrocarpum]